MRSHTIVMSALLTVAALALAGQRNESSRLPIKHATDAGAAKIGNRPKKTTIEDMLNQTRPDGLAPDLSSPEYQNKRIDKFETTKWAVAATITQVVKRADGDYYCTIESPSGAKTVFEAPDPALCAGSHYLAEIKAVRQKLEELFHPTAQPQKVNVKVNLVGLGFFGYQGKAPASGPRPNGARLMPLLGIKVSK